MGHCKNYRPKKRRFSRNQYSKKPTLNNAQHENEVSTARNDEQKTASASKLEGLKQTFSDNIYSEGSSELFGHRIYDIRTLISVFAVLCCPVCFQDNLSLTEDSRFGICSNSYIKCKNCDFVKVFVSSEKINNAFNLNTLLVYALRLIGKGYTAGNKLFSMLDLPFLSKRAFRNQELKILRAATEAAKKSMLNAADKIRKENPLTDISYCGVSLDGTWQKRGYSSHNGCVSCISIDTGKVLDVEMMSHFCRICNKMSNTPGAFPGSHVCRNHKGSASSMETIGVYRIFERSENLRKLQYRDYYGDGDSKGYESVKNMYGPNTVNKFECIGHVQKRVGSHLRKLKKSTKGIGGRGKLTDSFIDKLQNYYGIAIRSNINNLESMQRAVIAAFYHCCSSKDFPMHGQCPQGKDSWCKFQKAKAQGKTLPDKSTGLSQNIINIIKPTYMKLCDQTLLKKCLHGMTQNANESFNGVLWNIIPKQHFTELQTLQLGAYLAVLQFNEGASGFIEVMNKLQLNVGNYMLRILKQYDFRRITDAKRHSLPLVKLQRKKARARRKIKILQQEKKEGLTYHPGEF